ncbi:MAG: hypothetical protein AAF950_18020 [Pseudomonadota bacterium]
MQDKAGKVAYVEVKFRSDGTVSMDKVAADVWKDWPTRFIRLRRDRKPYFEVYLAPHEQPDPEAPQVQWLPLLEVEGWVVDPDLYAYCETLVEDYYPAAQG